MLLSTINSNTSSPTVEAPNPLDDYLKRLSGQEKEHNIITVDHNYSKFWYSHSDSQHAKPARMLFMKGLLHRTTESNIDSDAVIDVDTVDSNIGAPYDNAKTRGFMEECDQFLATNMPDQPEEEKELINKSGWTMSQKNLYKQVLKVLCSNRLSRLAYSGTDSELVRRRVIINKGARKIRQIFAAQCWDITLLGWLHCTLLDNLSSSLSAEYFEIIRTLKAKIPNLIDKLLARSGACQSSASTACSTEAFTQLMRKPWDPVINILSQNKMKKLPSNPLIVIVPSSPNHMMSHLSQRTCFWNFQLSALGKVVQLPVHISNNITVEEGLHQMFTMTKNKVVDLKSQNPKRPIILLGWTIGALIACHVAIEEPVTAVVCLGFPLTGIDGLRGDLDDPILDCKVPTLFVIGQNANTCSINDIEDFRERMRAETSLVVVGGADDKLRTSTTKKRSDGVTQNMVDKCILDEIEDFLVPQLNHQYPTHSASQPSTSKKNVKVSEVTTALQDDAKRQRRRPREYSPEISPVKKKSRPVGRPSLQKVYASSSSETSSAGSDDGSSRKDRRKLSRKRATSLKKRNSRISASSLRQNNSGKIEITKDSVALKNALVSPVLSVEPATTPTTPSDKLNPAKILADQQKNGPVDVEKAFGKDSSFLPRPLTPAELDATGESAVAKSPETVVSSVASTTPEVKVSESTVLEVPVADKPKTSFLRTSIGNFPLTTFSTNVSSTVAIQKPQVVSKIMESGIGGVKDSSVQKLQSADVITLAGKSIIANPPTKILSGGGLSVKHVHGIVSSLTSKGLLSTNSGIAPKTLLVSSPASASNTTTTLLVSNSGEQSKKIQVRRMLVQGGPSTKLPIFSKLTSTGGGGGMSVLVDSKSTEQRVCNLSLLSDVAGMKEPILQMTSDGQGSSTATLVKVTSPSEGGVVKRLRVIEAFPSTSVLTPPRFESAEEQAEKQMAIRALNSSLNEDGSANYSTPKVDNPMLGYSLIMPKTNPALGMRIPPRRARGRGFMGFPLPRKPRVRRFYPF